MQLIYVAHKFCGDLRNADRAELLTAELNQRFDGAIFICPWLPMVRHWVDSGPSRELGLRLDLECVRKCDAIIALTKRSGGVLKEFNAAADKSRYCVDSTAWDCGNSWPEESSIQLWVNSIGAF